MLWSAAFLFKHTRHGEFVYKFAGMRRSDLLGGMISRSRMSLGQDSKLSWMVLFYLSCISTLSVSPVSNYFNQKYIISYYNSWADPEFLLKVSYEHWKE